IKVALAASLVPAVWTLLKRG
ncbi:biotin transporter BioY, partial [Mesorhizobium sp. M7A.F.Ca.US.001.01.1.1]